MILNFALISIVPAKIANQPVTGLAAVEGVLLFGAERAVVELLWC